MLHDSKGKSKLPKNIQTREIGALDVFVGRVGRFVLLTRGICIYIIAHKICIYYIVYNYDESSSTRELTL